MGYAIHLYQDQSFTQTKPKFLQCPTERFLIDPLLPNPPNYFREYDKGEHSPAQVKQLIQDHLRDKEEIEASIPANITIGPFWITCDGVRQSLAKKKKALANSVLEFLAKKLRKQADEVC